MPSSEFGHDVQVIMVDRSSGLRTFKVPGEAVMARIFKTITRQPLGGPMKTADLTEAWRVFCSRFLPGLRPLDYAVTRAASLHAGTLDEDITLMCHIRQNGGRDIHCRFSNGSLEPVGSDMQFRFGTGTLR